MKRFPDCYKVPMEAASHESPLEELYRRRNEMSSHICESSQNDKFVVGLEKATRYVKDQVEAERQKRIFLAGGKQATKWEYNMDVLYHLNKSFDDLLHAMLRCVLSKSEASKPKEKRSYNVQKCFAWLIHWFDFGNECKYLATFEECIALDKIYGIMRAADGSAYYAMDPARMQNASATNTICTVEVLMRVCWMDAHCTLFDQIESGNDTSWHIDFAWMRKQSKLSEQWGLSVSELVRLEKLLCSSFICGPSTTINVFMEDANEALFFDGLALQWNTICEDLHVKIVGSKKKWSELIDPYLQSGEASTQQFWSKFFTASILLVSQ